jgi:signal transduction histidine kinase
MDVDALSMLDVLPDAVIVFASDWCILGVNRTAEMLLGAPREELMGKALGRELLCVDEARSAVYRDVMRHRTPRRVPGVRMDVPGAAARFFDGEVHAMAGGGIVVLFRDTTLRPRRESNVPHARDDLDSASRNQLLATLSHEMRTPLNAILGYTELMEMQLAGPLTTEQHTHLDRVRMSARHLLDLVNAVLQLARIEAGQLTTVTERALAGDAIQVALALVHPQVAAGRLTLIDRSAEQPPVPYLGHVIQVRQILVNLLSNAVKFAGTGGRIEVECWTAATLDADVVLDGPGPWACVRVRDTGIGIPPDETERIFEPFVQLDVAHVPYESGSGLGLAISRRLARHMGGDLSVRSRPGEGSAFTLWLPSPPPEPRGVEP